MSRSTLISRPVRAVLGSAAKAVFGAALVLAAAGCEDRGSANQEAINKLYDGLAQVGQLPDLQPGDKLKAADQALLSATQVNDAGPGVQAVTNAAVAAIDQAAAATGAMQLSGLEADVRATLLQLRRLGDLLAAANAAAQSASTAADAKDALEKVSADISSMQGNPQAPTWNVGPVSVPSLVNVKQKADALAAEITERQAQIADMTKQRTDALAAAEQQSTHAGQLKGDEAVKAYADAAESRRKGNDLAIKIDLVQEQLNRLQADAAVQQGQQAVLDAGIKALHEQGTLIETDKGQTQKASAAFKTVAGTILEGNDDTKVSIKTVAAELKTKIDALAAARSNVLTQLQEAEKAANTANQQAGQLASSIAAKLTNPGKEADAYRGLKATVSAPQYMYLLGTVRRDAAVVTAGQGSLLADVKDVVDGVKKAVSDAGLAAPADLDAIDASTAKALIDEAGNKFKDASESLANVETGEGTERLKQSAKIARLITLDGYARLADARKAAGDALAGADPAAIRSDAIALRAELQQANVPLPALPGDPGEAAPATAPATGAPAAGDAPATTPATPAT